MTRLAAAVVAALAVAVVGVRVADAHASSVTYNRAVVAGDHVDYRVQIDRLDASVLIGDELDPAAMTADQRTALALAVTHAITITDGDGDCLVGQPTVEPDGERVAVAWTITCPAPIAVLVLTYDLLFFDDPGHTAALDVEVPGRRPATTLLDVDHARFVWPLHPPPTGFALVGAGLRDVATGVEHLGFVLALLLAVVLARERDGAAWRPRPLGQAVRMTAVVVGAFVVGHLLTLFAATLGWVVVPARLVDAAIVVSIAWTALEAVLRPYARWRFALPFGFGLVHGLGFARALAALLPPGPHLGPVLAFGLGVELTHLALIAVALPTLWLLARFRR